MESISSAIVVGVIVVIAALVNIGCNVYRAFNSGRRTPPIGEDQAASSTRLDTLEEWTKGKQSKALCDQRYNELMRMMGESTEAYGKLVEKMSSQIGGVHTRINDIFGELREIAGAVKTHMEKEHEQ